MDVVPLYNGAAPCLSLRPATFGSGRVAVRHVYPGCRSVSLRLPWATRCCPFRACLCHLPAVLAVYSGFCQTRLPIRTIRSIRVRPLIQRWVCPCFSLFRRNRIPLPNPKITVKVWHSPCGNVKNGEAITFFLDFRLLFSRKLYLCNVLTHSSQE